MTIKHRNKTPQVAKSAYVAPNAVICGDVVVGENARIMFGAQIIGENSRIEIGDNCIVLENAVIRATGNNPVQIGKNCLIGPHAHIAGCTLEDNVFIATGASVFHGAIIGEGAEVRINGVVHLRTVLPSHTTVPIHWVAVGNPAQLFSPDRHEEIWEIQRKFNFPEFVYGLKRSDYSETKMPKVAAIMSHRLGTHLDDEVIGS